MKLKGPLFGDISTTLKKKLWEVGAVVMWRLAADIFALQSTVCLIEM